MGDAEHIVEVAFVHNSDALRGLCRAQVIILVIIAIVGLQSPSTGFIQQVFNVDVTDKLVGVNRAVAVTEVSV